MPIHSRRNPHRRCCHTLEPPIEVSIRGDLFNEIVDNLGSRRAITLRTELHRLLLLPQDHSQHLRIVRIISQLQNIIRHHPQQHEFNYQILCPAPRFDSPLPEQGPGYATGNVTTYVYFICIDKAQEDMDLTIDDDDYEDNMNNIVDMDLGDDDYEIDSDEDLYQPSMTTPSSSSTIVLEEDEDFLESTYFLVPKQNSLLQKAISRSQALIILEFNADGISLQRWEKYFWIHRFSSINPL